MTNRFSTPHEKPSQHKKRQAKTCRWSKYGTANISLVQPQSIPVFAVCSPCGPPVFVRFVSCGSQNILRCRGFLSSASCKSTSTAFEPKQSLPVLLPCRSDSPVPAREVQCSFSGDDPSDFAEHAFQVRISLIDMGALAFSVFSLLPDSNEPRRRCAGNPEMHSYQYQSLR